MSEDTEKNTEILEKLLKLVRNQESFRTELFDLRQRLDLLLKSQTQSNSELNVLHSDLLKLNKNKTPDLHKSDSKQTSEVSIAQPLKQRKIPKFKHRKSSKLQDSKIPNEIPRLQDSKIPNQTPRFQDSKIATPIPKVESSNSEAMKSWNGETSAKPFSAPEKSSVEKFIGENLISLIGIVITIIGVGIGAKYAIDNNLISPIFRIALGYVFGFGLLGIAARLKPNYHNFSAVLMSGALAILFFITFAAHSFFGLISQNTAFSLMFVITVFTVVTALLYNSRVIAHIGLVGAYTVPFLLGGNAENIGFLFAYMAIINVGILTVATYRYWKSLHFSAFVVTWLIFLAWFATTNRTANFGTAFTFAAIFFAIFYALILAYKFRANEAFNAADVVLLLPNSFIFFAVGYALLDSSASGKRFEGFFTLINAAIHCAVGIAVYRFKLADRNIFYLIIGLALVFITITVPIQLDGNWVTLLWTGETALLFWIGRTQKVSFYETASYFMLPIAFFSLLLDWARQIDQLDVNFVAVFNPTFLTSAIFIGAIAFLIYINRKFDEVSDKISPAMFLHILFSTLFLFTLYAVFALQIVGYFEQLKYAHQSSPVISELSSSSSYNNPYLARSREIELFRVIWLINYSLFFFSLLSLINFQKLKSRVLTFVSLGFISLFILIFLTVGYAALGWLSNDFLNLELAEISSSYQIFIRYISFAFFGVAMWFGYRDFKKILNLEERIEEYRELKTLIEILFSLLLLWLLSNELIMWLNIGHFSDVYKSGLSIWWGIYSLILIVLGIAWRKQHLRILAMVIFTVTLIKLFFYDIVELDTISKTVVFVALGILLLIISFLYNKFKALIAGEDKIQPTEIRQDRQD